MEGQSKEFTNCWLATLSLEQNKSYWSGLCEETVDMHVYCDWTKYNNYVLDF